MTTTTTHPGAGDAPRPPKRAFEPDAAAGKGLAGDVWGGLAAMLVALPSAIAFGVTIYAPLGSAHAATGALAGILGATALGLVAPALGGAKRLITAPCAPAAAVLSAFVIEAVAGGASIGMALSSMVVLGLLAGALQIDAHSLGFVRSRSTMLDFAVIVAVVAVALSVSLIAASGVGVVLAVILFVREQIGGSVVRRKSYASSVFAKTARLAEEMKILEAHGDRAVIFELQGSLFFGTTDQLQTALEPELHRRSYVILDMRRVQSVDITAAHVLDLVEDVLTERGAVLILSQVPKSLPSGQDVRKYFGEVGLVRQGSPVRVFDDLDSAVQWVQDRILEEATPRIPEACALELTDFGIWKGRKAETLADLAAHMEPRSYRAGARIFAQGDDGDALCLIRRGRVRIVLPLPDRQHLLGTFGRGDFFGEMSFLDGTARSADAIAETDVELFILSRRAFEALADEHKRAAIGLLAGIASALSTRLRYANAEICALE